MAQTDSSSPPPSDRTPTGDAPAAGPPGALGAALGRTPGGVDATVVGAAVAHASGAQAAERATAGRAPSAPAGAHPIGHAPSRARGLVGQLAALPGLARAADDTAESAAERLARRRRAAQATLDAEAAETDWARVGVFGAGIVIGALIGAGTALLLAPATGFETRTRLARRAREVGGRAAERVEDATDDARYTARRGAKHVKKRVKRAATASRWAVEDAWERRRGRDA